MSVSVHFTIAEYYRPGSHKIAMALPELVHQTNNFSVKNQPGCVPKLSGSDPKTLFLEYNVKCNLKTSDPAGHDVKVRFDLDAITDETKAKDLDVECSCSCPAFLYWGGQWNLHQRDALEGEPRPLLTAPTERLDLRNHFLICKHVKVVMDRILPSVQHNIVKIIRKRNVDKYHKEHPEPEQTPAPKRVPRKKEKAAPPVKEQVIERDTPATTEERQKKPTLTKQELPTAEAPLQPKFKPVPVIEELVEEPAAAVPPPAPTPNQPAAAPRVPRKKEQATPAKLAPAPGPLSIVPKEDSASRDEEMSRHDRDFMTRLKRQDMRVQERRNSPQKRPGRR